MPDFETRPVRARMIDGATQILARRGLRGTAFSEVIALAGASRGSIYHHFPGGKAELIDAVLTQYTDALDQQVQPDRPPGGGFLRRGAGPVAPRCCATTARPAARSPPPPWRPTARCRSAAPLVPRAGRHAARGPGARRPAPGRRGPCRRFPARRAGGCPGAVPRLRRHRPVRRRGRSGARAGGATGGGRRLNPLRARLADHR